MAEPDVFEGFAVEEAIAAAKQTYGEQAKTAAAWCAFSARFDGRDGDYRLWFQVFKRLDNSDIAH